MVSLRDNGMRNTGDLKLRSRRQASREMLRHFHGCDFISTELALERAPYSHERTKQA
ncbi:hypothetical protein J2Y48_002594 [Mycoplana sp. BE70]|nr:hypothetical protein [Mycoplana sp. BE70]